MIYVCDVCGTVFMLGIYVEVCIVEQSCSSASITKHWNPKNDQL